MNLTDLEPFNNDDNFNQRATSTDSRKKIFLKFKSIKER